MRCKENKNVVIRTRLRGHCIEETRRTLAGSTDWRGQAAGPDEERHWCRLGSPSPERASFVPLRCHLPVNLNRTERASV